MIFLTGPHNAGKTTLAEELKKFGFLHIETSAIVRFIHKEMAPYMDFHAWAKVVNHQFDGLITGKVQEAIDRIRSSGRMPQDLIVTGNRQWEGVNYILEHVTPLDGRPNLLLYLQARDESLYQRELLRCDRSPCPSLTAFQELLRFDQEMGVSQLRDHADVILGTDGSVEDCFDLAAGYLRERGYRISNFHLEGRQSRGPEFEI